jgi:Protein of unknown function (DUF1552)
MKKLSRRAVLHGMGATIALPFLEAMGAPARSVPSRLVCIEMVHGAAGSTKYGLEQNLWAPAATGRSFDLSPTCLSPLEPFREYLTIVSNTDVHNADTFERSEAGGDHPRSSAVFLTQCRPKHTLGPDVRAGTSLDQIYAHRCGQDSRVPSLQLCIEDSARVSASELGYSGVYRNTICWASPTQPLPMIRDPRMVFDQLFGAPAWNRQTAMSILDWVAAEARRLSRNLPPADRIRLDEYLTDIREIERRIQIVENYHMSTDLPGPTGSGLAVPDDFEEHVKLMFDLQVQAFAAEVTRVAAFKLGLDTLTRTYPGSGVSESFHAASHHGEKEDKVAQFARINRYHVGLIPYFLEKLKNTPERDSNLLEKSVILYGSPMGDSNLHNHERCPLFIAGHASGKLSGNFHIKAPDGTPMANAMLGLLQSLGVDTDQFGDSSKAMTLNH